MTSSENSNWIENAILIYGPRKGGTTLFQNLLDGGSHLFVYPAELKLKYMVKAKHLSPAQYFSHSRVPANESRAVPAETLKGDWDAESYFRHSREYNVGVDAFDRAAYKIAWEADPDVRQDVGALVRKDAIRVFVNSRFRSTSPIGWCAKEVGGRPRRVLRLWKSIFPQGRLLLITRDPRMVARSVLQDRRRVNVRPSLRNLLKQIHEPMAVNDAIEVLRGIPGVHILRYEDLVRDTRHVMEGVADFLQISFEEIFTRPTLLGDDVVVRTSSRVEKSVFASDAKWFDGLTFRERLVVGAVYRLMRVWYRIRGRR